MVLPILGYVTDRGLDRHWQAGCAATKLVSHDRQQSPYMESLWFVWSLFGLIDVGGLMVAYRCARTARTVLANNGT